MLASAHKMKDDKDYCQLDYLKVDINKYCKLYLEELKEVVMWGDFDCLAHFDLPRRYAANAGVKLPLMEYTEQVEEVLKLLIYKGKGLEINTSGLRQQAKTCLPDLDILTLYKQLGGEILTIGSDAHSTGDLGKGIVEAIEMAKLAGFRYVNLFDKRVPKWVGISEKASFYSAPVKLS